MGIPRLQTLDISQSMTTWYSTQCEEQNFCSVLNSQKMPTVQPGKLWDDLVISLLKSGPKSPRAYCTREYSHCIDRSPFCLFPRIYLNVLSDTGKHLCWHRDGTEEAVTSCGVNGVLARVMPVEVHHGLLQTQQVVDSRDDDVHCCCVASLGTQVVLEFWKYKDECWDLEQYMPHWNTVQSQYNIANISPKCYTFFRSKIVAMPFAAIYKTFRERQHPWPTEIRKCKH